jgi:hypothetical protein
MTENDREVFTKLWTAAWDTCGKAVTGMQLRMAFFALSDISIEDVKRAILAHARDPERGRFPVTPADVMAYLHGTAKEQAEIHWPDVLRAIRGSGRNFVVFTDPVVHRVIHDMGGLCTLGRMAESELPFVQRDFIARYVSTRKRWTPDTPYPNRLRARLIPANEGDDDTTFIGDRQQCQHVLLGRPQPPEETT